MVIFVVEKASKESVASLLKILGTPKNVTFTTRLPDNLVRLFIEDKLPGIKTGVYSNAEIVIENCSSDKVLKLYSSKEFTLKEMEWSWVPKKKIITAGDIVVAYFDGYKLTVNIGNRKDKKTISLLNKLANLKEGKVELIVDLSSQY